MPPSRSRTRRSSEVSTGSSLHPLAVDLDAEIERKPPAASLGYRRVPVAVAGDDARPEIRVDLDAPAIPLQRRHGVVNKAGPRRRVVIEAEREQLALAFHLREVGRRQQPGCGEPPVKGGFRRIMPPPHDDAPVLDMAQLGGRRGRVDDLAVVLVAEEGDVDAIVAAAGAERVAVGALAGREAQHRHRRLAADFLDQFGPRRRQAKARKTPRQRLGERRRLVRRHRRRGEKRGGDVRRHAEIERSGEALPGIDIPGRGAGQDFALALGQPRLDRLIAAGCRDARQTRRAASVRAPAARR